MAGPPPPSPSANEGIRDLLSRVRPSVATLVPEDEAGRPMAQGAGFFTGPGRLVTSRHLLQGARAARVLLASGAVHPVAGLLAEDPVGDLALLGVEGPTDRMKPLDLATTAVREGERVVVVGSPLVPEKSAVESHVALMREVPGLGTVLQLGSPIPPASSGCPVVRMTGEIVGVAVVRSVEGLRVAFAVPVGRVRALRVAELTQPSRWSLPDPDAEATYLAALRAFLDGDYEEALERYRGIAARDGDDPLAWTVVGECLVGLGRWEESMDACRRALALDPEDFRAHAAVGVCHYNLGRLPDAVESYRHALRSRPDEPRILNRLGVALAEMGKRDEAVDAYGLAIRAKPEDAQAHKNLGVALYQLERHAEAVEAFRGAIRLKPDFARAFNDLGLACFALGRFPEAVEAYRQAIRIRPDFARAHNNLGVAYYRLDRAKEAVEAYDQALHLRPDYAVAHANRATACARLGRYAEAVESDRKAIGIHPEDAEAHTNLGVVYEKLGRVQEAIGALRQALHIDPDNARARFYLGLALCSEGDKGGALREYETLKGLDAARAEKLFERIYKS